MRNKINKIVHKDYRNSEIKMEKWNMFSYLVSKGEKKLDLETYS